MPNRLILFQCLTYDQRLRILLRKIHMIGSILRLEVPTILVKIVGSSG